MHPRYIYFLCRGAAQCKYVPIRTSKKITADMRDGVVSDGGVWGLSSSMFRFLEAIGILHFGVRLFWMRSHLLRRFRWNFGPGLVRLALSLCLFVCTWRRVLIWLVPVSLQSVPPLCVRCGVPLANSGAIPSSYWFRSSTQETSCGARVVLMLQCVDGCAGHGPLRLHGACC